MRRVLMLLGGLAAVASGCGGGTKQPQGGVPMPPVTQQVRHALVDSLRNPSLPAITDAQRPRLPFIAVAGCSRPDGGGAGQYQCATTPRGADGMRSITVQVDNKGQWSTQPLTVRTQLHGRPTSAVTSVWGVGIQLPSDPRH
jgi:hypothetical protein